MDNRNRSGTPRSTGPSDRLGQWLRFRRILSNKQSQLPKSCLSGPLIRLDHADGIVFRIELIGLALDDIMRYG